MNDNKTQYLQFSSNNEVVTNSVKLLGVNVDNKLMSQDHVENLAPKLNKVVYQ